MTGLSSPPAPPDEGRAVYSDYKAAGAHPPQASSLPVSLGFGPSPAPSQVSTALKEQSSAGSPAPRAPTALCPD